MRIMAVDHGEKRIGLALSDPNAILASPLKVIEHVSRLVDAAQVADLAAQNEVGLIVIGQSFDEEGRPNLAGRRAARFAEVQIAPEPVPESSGIELRLSNGCCVVVRAGFDRRTLLDLLATLEHGGREASHDEVGR